MAGRAFYYFEGAAPEDGWGDAVEIARAGDGVYLLAATDPAEGLAAIGAVRLGAKISDLVDADRLAVTQEDGQTPLRVFAGDAIEDYA